MRSGLDSPPMGPSGPVLAFDFASPVASAAVARSGEIFAVRELARVRGDDRDLLQLLDEVLAQAGVERQALGGVAALRGPGSFTGARVACATALGIAQGLSLPATGVSTLEALALGAPTTVRRVLAVVDALRGEWYCQRFEEGRATAEPAVAAPHAGLWRDVDAIVGCDLQRLFAALPTPQPVRIEARRLAEPAAIHASLGRWSWDESTLRYPLYLRAPATTSPR